jgi:hypothetical protein
MSTIKLIKKDAIIKLEIGTGFIEKLHRIITKTAESVKEEDIQKFKEHVSKNETLPETWMETIAVISSLVKLIETKAEEQGHIEEMSLAEYLNKQTGSELFSKDGDSLQFQSPEQPE